MFDFVRRNTKLLQILMFLLVFPSFVIFGIQGYDRLGSSADIVAKVAGIPIRTEQLDAAQRDQVARMQQMLGGSVDVAQLDTPAMKMRTLDGLVREVLLQVAVRKQHLVVGDSELQQAILQIPQVAALRRADGSFDVDAYNRLLQEQGMSSSQFEAQVREQLLRRQAMGGIADNVIDSQTLADQLAAWQSQQRRVRVAMYLAKDETARVQITDADVAAYYKAHPEQFKVPQQASVEYVVLDPAALRQSVTVSEQQLHEYYDAHAAQYGGTPQRRASHILIALAADATPAQDAAAKAKAEAIAAEAKKDPSRFAAIARQQSQDPGSAAAGGDLGFFARDGMVKPFADAVFGMTRAGEIVGPVKSQYGYHIIELTAIKPASGQSFAQARAEIDAKLRDAAVEKSYADIADKFGNQVYEDSRSFAGVASTYHLKVQTAQGATQVPQAGDPKTSPLANPHFMQMLFGANSLHDQRNIAAVELSRDVLASGRIVSLQAATQLTLAQAQDKARALLAQERAAQIGQQRGAQALAAARAGSAQPAWGPELELTQPGKPQAVPDAVVEAAFHAPTDKLPALTGVALPGQGYAVISVDAVQAGKSDPEQARAQAGQMRQLLAQAVGDAYVEGLKQQYGVQILYKPTPAN
jgi:peptidyl-prolyl cis-trans isomerase D